MLSLIIWWVAIFLELALLYRGLRSKLFLRYPNFYIYILGMCFCDVLLYPVYVFKPLSYYYSCTYYAGCLTVFLGCGVLLEIFRQVLSPYAGAEKFARVSGYILFGAIICFAILGPMMFPASAAGQSTYLTIQKGSLASQAVLLFGLLQVISYFGIPMGRNLKGMILGYGQCLAVSVIIYALRTYLGRGFWPEWNLTQQLSYLAALVIWLAGLWSYFPNPIAESSAVDDGDYEILAARTRDLVGAAGAQLAKVDRS